MVIANTMAERLSLDEVVARHGGECLVVMDKLLQMKSSLVVDHYSETEAAAGKGDYPRELPCGLTQKKAMDIPIVLTAWFERRTITESTPYAEWNPVDRHWTLIARHLSESVWNDDGAKVLHGSAVRVRL